MVKSTVWLSLILMTALLGLHTRAQTRMPSTMTNPRLCWHSTNSHMVTLSHGYNWRTVKFS